MNIAVDLDIAKCDDDYGQYFVCSVSVNGYSGVLEVDSLEDFLKPDQLPAVITKLGSFSEVSFSPFTLEVSDIALGKSFHSLPTSSKSNPTPSPQSNFVSVGILAN